jgi:putative colanic acid biosysnthesis UDP-glucose lipid carrier transferase
MIRSNFKYIKRVLSTLDLLFLIILLLEFLKIHYNLNLEEYPSILNILKSHYKAIFILVLAWFTIADYIKLYAIKRLSYLREILKKIIYQIFFFSVLIFAISGIKKDELFSNNLIIILSLILFTYLLLTRISFFFWSRSRFDKGENIKNILIVGQNESSLRLKSILNSRKHFGYNVYEYTSNSDFQFFIDIVHQNNIQDIFFSQSGTINDTFDRKILNFCEDHHIRVNYIPFSINNELISLEVQYIDTLPVFKIKKFPLEKANHQFLKLIFDIVFSSLVCVFVLSWLYPIFALLIKLDSKGPVIFKQKRRGFGGETFVCYKFRTMVEDGTNSIKATTVGDKRVTKLGSFLRKSSLDELPQFINVLKGEMSIVGPRPHMISQDKYYSEIINKYNIRNYVKPGITGLAQVKGFRGAVETDKDMEGRIQVDIFYVRNWSLLIDLQVIYQTIGLIIKGDKNAI